MTRNDWQRNARVGSPTRLAQCGRGGQKPQDFTRRLAEGWPLSGNRWGRVVVHRVYCALAGGARFTQGRTEPKRQTTSDESHIPFDRFPRTILLRISMRKVSSFNEYLQHLQGYSAAKKQIAGFWEMRFTSMPTTRTRSFDDLADELGPVLLSGNDVCGIEQLSAPKSAHSAPCLVGEEDAATEFRLM